MTFRGLFVAHLHRRYEYDTIVRIGRLMQVTVSRRFAKALEMETLSDPVLGPNYRLIISFKYNAEVYLSIRNMTGKYRQSVSALRRLRYSLSL